MIRFDFGPNGEAESGFTKVDAAAVYDPERGYGFTDVSLVTAHDRREGEALQRDFCIPFSTSFQVDVPNGNYQVTLWHGDAIAPTSTTLKAGRGRMIFRNKTTLAGVVAQEMFAVNVSDGRLKLAFSGAAPRLNALEITASPQTVTLFIAGDSTVTDQDEAGYPYAGWGQMLPMLFKHDVAIANHAVSGRSSKSFIDEGRLDAIAGEMKEDDYLFVQFGHNDQKKDKERRTEPTGSYIQYLMRYIGAARACGARPVLVTSVHRRFFEKDGKLRDTHGPYLDAVRELAAKEDVPFIDLAEKSRVLFEELGEEGTKDVFMWGAQGEFIAFPSGVQDNTHFQERGAIRIAELVAEEIKRLKLWPLSLYLK